MFTFFRFRRQDDRPTTRRPQGRIRPMLEDLEGRKVLSTVSVAPMIVGAHIGTNVALIQGGHIGTNVADRVGDHGGTNVTAMRQGAHIDVTADGIVGQHIGMTAGGIIGQHIG